MGTRNDVTEHALRELAGLRADGDTVLSIYLDLDPSGFATAPARQTEIDSLLDEAHREIEETDRPHAELMALRGALARARELLTPTTDLAKGARSLAVFISEPLGLERPLRLPHPVTNTVIISDEPFIAPLAEVGPRGRVCVALVGERFARILRGSADRLQESVSFGDDVHGRQHQGGWSQDRYQRSSREEVEGHLRHTARVLRDLLRVAPYDTLLIASSETLWPRLVEKLEADVRTRLRDERLSLDVGDAGIADVEGAVAEVLSAEHREHEDQVLGRLREEVAREGRAASGLEAVLEALVERRVETLLYDEGLTAKGVLCDNCGWMGIAGESCPVDGTQLEPREDIVEDAVQAAVSQDAEVLVLHDRPDLGPLGGIAATLRF